MRGAALVYILVLTIAITSVLLSIIALAGQYYSAQTKREQALRTEYIFEGASAYCRYYLNAGLFTLPLTGSNTMGTFTVTGTITDNSASIPRTAKVDLTTTRWGRTFKRTYIIGNNAPIDSPSLWSYAAAFNSTVARTATISTYSTYATADWYQNQNISVTNAGSTIQGNLVLTGSPASANITATAKLTSQSVMPWPIPRNPWYEAAANTTFVGNKTYASGLTFGFANQLIVVTGDLAIQGPISGSGTIFVEGNVTITDDMTYADGVSQIAIVTPGTITVNPSSVGRNHMVGYAFAGSGLVLGDDLMIDRGAVVASTVTGSGFTLESTFDPTVKTTPATGVNLKLPGLWP